MAFERLHPGTLQWQLYQGNHVARYEFAIRELAGAAKLLDSACGVGYGTKMLAERLGADVVGVDRSDEALGIARAEFAHAKAAFLKDDCSTLAEAAKHGPFDGVISMETLEHLPIPVGEQFVSAVKRSLKPGGKFLVSTPNGELFNRGRDWEFHEHEYSAGELVELLRKAGFERIDLYGQKLNPMGAMRESMRAELNAIRANPVARFGRFLQRLRGLNVDRAVLPESVDDFEFVRIAEGDAHTTKRSFVLLAVAHA